MKYKRILVLISIIATLFGVFIFIINRQPKEPEIVGDNVLFKDGLCPFSVDGRLVYIDKKGKVMLDDNYKLINSFSEGVATVCDDNSYYIINTNGERVATISDKVSNVSEEIWDRGMELLSNEDAKFTEDRLKLGYYSTEKGTNKHIYGYMNKEGKWVIHYQFEDVGDFKEGRAVVAKNDKYGYINKFGREVIPLIYDYATDFDDGYAVVGADDKFGIIDKDGKIVVDINCEYVSEYDNRGLRYIERFGKKLFIDNEGNEVIDVTEYEEVTDFSETDDLAAVKMNGKYGYINTNGKVEIEPYYEKAETFVNGHAIVVTDGKHAIINKENKYTVKPKEFIIYNLTKSGIAKYRSTSKDDIRRIGYISANGEIISDAIFYDASNFYDDGYAVVSVFGYHDAIIDINGKYLIEPKYRKAHNDSDYIAPVWLQEN